MIGGQYSTGGDTRAASAGEYASRSTVLVSSGPFDVTSISMPPGRSRRFGSGGLRTSGASWSKSRRDAKAVTRCGLDGGNGSSAWASSQAVPFRPVSTSGSTVKIGRFPSAARGACRRREPSADRHELARRRGSTVQGRGLVPLRLASMRVARPFLSHRDRLTSHPYDDG